MAPDSPSLTVRLHERFDCSLPARLAVSDDHAAAVSISRASGGESFEATIVDVSDGGIGLRSEMFLPKSCRVDVSVRLGDTAAVTTVRVQRVAMLDRVPTYYIGAAFRSDGSDRASVAAFISLVQRLVEAETRGPHA